MSAATIAAFTGSNEPIESKEYGGDGNGGKILTEISCTFLFLCETLTTPINVTNNKKQTANKNCNLNFFFIEFDIFLDILPSTFSNIYPRRLL